MPDSLTSSQLIKLLKQNGFTMTRQKGSHQIFYNQKTNRRVTVPFHRRDMPTGTLSDILKQAGLK